VKGNYSALLSIFFLIVFVSTIKAQTSPLFYQKPYELWADSVISTLSPDERIGQLFIVAAYSDTASHNHNIEEVTKLIQDQKIGGLIFFKGGPVSQAQLTNTYQSISQVPLLIGMDAEWGLAMRLDSVPKFPFQMTLGAMDNDSLVYKMGVEIARECRRLGVQEDFAPVIDINDNPENPVIGMRSFGEDKMHVTKMGIAYMQGLQSEHVLACGKHFPGHGDTKTDSHLSLPIVDFPESRLDTLEFYPFEQLFKNGLSSTMVAHLYIPALDSTKNRASTLSPKIVADMLKEKMGFKGLVYTDALNMQGVAKFYEPGEVDVKALLAGNDVLLFSQDVPKAIEEIKKAIKKKEITQEDIDARCKKILMAKAWAGLNHYKPISLTNLVQDINSHNADVIIRQIAENSVTLLSNKNSLLPLQRLDTLKIASLVIGDSLVDEFQTRMNDYANVTHFNMSMLSKDSVISAIYPKLKGYNLVIIGVSHTLTKPVDTFNMKQVAIKMIDTIAKHYPTVIDFFSDPYLLAYLPQIKNARAIVMSYQNLPYTQDYSAQAIFGGIACKGRLPVTVSNEYKRGAGIQTKPIRFEYTLPEDAGVNPNVTSKIDSIANFGLTQKAYPGCVILVAKDCKVIYNKALGYQNYNDTTHAHLNDIYDLASITKIAATTPAIMNLVQDKQLDINKTLGTYLPKAKKTDKKNLIIREILAHQAGLQPVIFFWKQTMNGDSYRKGIYSSDSSAIYPYRVAAHMFIRANYPDTMMTEILKSKIDKSKQHTFVYSDLDFYLLADIAKNLEHTPLDILEYNNLYKPLGLRTMGFHPLYKFSASRIAPTEYDSTFRKQLLRGYVHDPGAAMMGGVSGHAGLFSDANDLAVLMQMFLQKGEYAGRRYFDSNVVKQFTSCAYCSTGNRRGLGFDKPEPNSNKESPAAKSASPESFGHSGFTGTFTWVDPKYNLVYVFLSNRVAGGSADNKLAKLNIRTDIQEAVYQAIEKK
jgi:beta-glucosidase-like glycosyl hydrolase/CubicO group peptidase (beta-lactamase class C family)